MPSAGQRIVRGGGWIALQHLLEIVVGNGLDRADRTLLVRWMAACSKQQAQGEFENGMVDVFMHRCKLQQAAVPRKPLALLRWLNFFSSRIGAAILTLVASTNTFAGFFDNPRNLQVLAENTSSDELGQMIRRVEEINASLAKAFPDSANLVTVSCATCHRGQSKPEMIEDVLASRRRCNWSRVASGSGGN